MSICGRKYPADILYFIRISECNLSWDFAPMLGLLFLITFLKHNCGVLTSLVEQCLLSTKEIIKRLFSPPIKPYINFHAPPSLCCLKRTFQIIDYHLYNWLDELYASPQRPPSHRFFWVFYFWISWAGPTIFLLKTEQRAEQTLKIDVRTETAYFMQYCLVCG